MEAVRIGAVEGDGPAVFSLIVDLKIDALRRFWVLHRQQQQIRVFERDGEHARTLGRRGEGPGEFTEAEGTALDSTWWLWVIDNNQPHFEVLFSPHAPGKLRSVPQHRIRRNTRHFLIGK